MWALGRRVLQTLFCMTGGCCVVGGSMMNQMAGMTPTPFAGVASRNIEDIEAFEAKYRAEEEARRKAMPIHLNITEAQGGWIISGSNMYDPLNHQIVATSIDEVLDILRGLMTREP